MLSGIDPQRALNNLNLHIQNSEFFPAISDIVRNDLLKVEDPEQKKLETTGLLQLKDSWLDTATPPPSHVKERWGKR